MPTYKVTIENEDFTSSDEQNCETQEQALKQALKAAITIASEQVSSGKPFFGAHVTLQQGKETLIRYVIGVGASPLKDS